MFEGRRIIFRPNDCTAAVSKMNCLCHDSGENYYYVSNRTYSFCRVKFGVPLDQVCKRDIPGPLLVSLKGKNVEAVRARVP